ncbi:coiled-coil domain-containing protein [Mycoplasma sp. B6188]|uniref:coiled-coil domain-containing protein n=1 Tax=unclassified Mycoplasma TaxID=2683645 RepID=UPI003AAA5811
MKIKFKKLPLILGSVAAAGLIPFSAVSCMYDDNPTIIYSKKFINDNGFSVKKHIASAEKPNLVEFENNLFNGRLLTYTFVNFKISPQSIVEVNNDRYKVTIKDVFTVNYKTNEIAADAKKIARIPGADNQKRIEQEIIQLNADLKQYIASAKDSTFYPNIPAQYRTLKGLIDAANMPREVFNSIKFLEYDDEGKVVIDKEKNKPREDGEAKKVVAKLVIALKALREYTYLDQEQFSKQIVTEADAKAVVENFLKDTPFYATYLNSLNNPETAIFKWDQASMRGTFNFQKVVKYYNSIPTSDFQQFQEKFFGSLENLKFTEINKNPVKYFKEIYGIMKTAFINYAVKLDAKESSGISLGFAPQNLIYGLNNDTGQASLKYTVFNPVLNDNHEAIATQTHLTPEQQVSFLSNPYLYFWTHATQLYLYSMNSIEIEIYGLQEQIKEIKAGKASGDIAALEEQIQTQKEMLAPYKPLLQEIEKGSQKAIELIEKIKTAESVEGKQEEIAKLKEELNEQLVAIKGNSDIKQGTITGGLLDNELIKDDILKVFKILNTEVSHSVTTISSLAALYSETLFGNGLYNIQLVKGSTKAINAKIAELQPQVDALNAKIKSETDGTKKAELEKQLSTLQAQLQPYADFAKSFYWIEFKDAEGKKYFFDVYKNYLSYQPNLEANFLPEYTNDLAQYNIDNAFSQTLPEGYVIDSAYNTVSYFGTPVTNN